MKILYLGPFAVVLALNFGSRADAQDKIRVGLSSVSALHGALWVAEQKGLFRKYGIETEIIVTGQGATAGIGALLQRYSDRQRRRRCFD